MPTASLSVGASLVVASLAGCINVVLTNPIWVLATRMQAGASGAQRQTVVRAVKEAFEEEGYQWIFKVLTGTLFLVGIVPFGLPQIGLDKRMGHMIYVMYLELCFTYKYLSLSFEHIFLQWILQK